MAGCGKMSRHRRAHDAKSNEGDFHYQFLVLAANSKVGGASAVNMSRQILIGILHNAATCPLILAAGGVSKGGIVP
jgi:hypothetical protein